MKEKNLNSPQFFDRGVNRHGKNQVSRNLISNRIKK